MGLKGLGFRALGFWAWGLELLGLGFRVWEQTKEGYVIGG